MKEYERKQLLERIDREAATVGADVPDEVELDGDPFPLAEFVFEVRALDDGARDRSEEVAWAKRQLRRARMERREEIEAGAVSFEDGERLAEEVVGIDRALNALESLGEADLEAQASRSERADTERWLTFLRTALGQDDDGPDVGRSRP